MKCSSCHHQQHRQYNASSGLGSECGGIQSGLYDYSCSWVPGCVTTVDSQSFGFPLGSPSEITAYLLVREDYTKCNNGGVGGSCQVGCLLYTFEGARGDETSDPCQDFDCNQCGTPFDPTSCQTCCATLQSIMSAGNGSTNNGLTIIDNM
ncbi:hypothetical protein BJ170DRAFT_624478 [Xylariales sp. AK1849]|nr:hypothetical protein BJ170DRAFT_624478 [Xylariales sp. AK1849]